MTDMQDYIAYLSSRQPTGIQTLLQAIPYFNYSKDMGKFFQPAQNLISAQTDINNPAFQNIYQQQQQLGKSNLAESIAELTRQNRKLATMGRVPLFSAERGGEQLFRNITKGYQDIQNNAANQTYDILGNAAKNSMALGEMQQKQALGKTGFTSNLAGAVGKLFGL